MTADELAALEAMLRRVVRSELEARTHSRIRAADVPAEPTLPVDDVSRARARSVLRDLGIGRRGGKVGPR